MRERLMKEILSYYDRAYDFGMAQRNPEKTKVVEDRGQSMQELAAQVVSETRNPENVLVMN